MNRYIITMLQTLIFWAVSANAVSNNCYVETLKGKKPAVRCVPFDKGLVVVTMCDGRVCKVAKEKVRSARFTCPRSHKKQTIHGIFHLETSEAVLFMDIEEKYVMKPTGNGKVYQTQGTAEEWLIDAQLLEAYKKEAPQMKFPIKNLDHIEMCF